MNKLRKCTSIIAILLLLVGCGGDNNEHFQTLYKSDSGHLRGASIGQGIDEIRALEDKAYLRDEMNDYLHYDYELNMGNSYTVTYDFSRDDRLYEIEVAVFFDAIEDAGTLFQDYEFSFNRKFGKGQLADDGFTIWNLENSEQNIEIAMINDSEAYGFLSIIVRDLNY